MIEFYLARYLVKPRFLLLLGLGTVVGIACFLIILSLFRNYQLSMEWTFMGIHPHLEISKEGMTIKEANQLIQNIKNKFPSIIVEAAPAIYKHLQLEIARVNTYKANCKRLPTERICIPKTTTPTELTYGYDILERDTYGVFLKGINVSLSRTVMRLNSFIQGKVAWSRLAEVCNPNGVPVLPGFYFEQAKLNEVLDDFLLRVKANNTDGNWYGMRLLGSLDLGRKKGDVPLLILGLPMAQQMLGIDYVNTIEIALSKPRKADTVAQNLRSYLSGGYKVISWMEREQGAFMFLKASRWTAITLISSLTFISALGVYSTLLLAVMQNRRKIAILLAMGIKRHNIYGIFVLNAWIVAIIGVTVGTILGYVGSDWCIAYFAERLSKLGVTNPTTQISGIDVLVVTAFTLILFTITAIIPARRAVYMDPITNLQK